MAKVKKSNDKVNLNNSCNSTECKNKFKCARYYFNVNRLLKELGLQNNSKKEDFYKVCKGTKYLLINNEDIDKQKQ